MKNDIQRIALITLIIMVGLFIYSRLGPPLPISVSSVVTNKNNVFSTSGTGKESVAPDQAEVMLGMQVSKTTIAEAQSEVNTKMNNLLTKLQQLGIEKKDIKTTNYSVNPQYNPTGDKITAYSVNTNVNVVIHDLAKINSVIDGATALGLNSVNGIQFTLSDKTQKEVMDKARQEAVKQAKEKAESLAKASGIRLGKIINVIEDSGPVNNPYVANSMMAKTADAAQPATALEPGQTEINLTVTLDYETY